MKVFENGRVQFVNYDEEADETYTVTLSNLAPDADPNAILAIGAALDTVIDAEFDHAKVVETHRVLA